MNSLYFNGQRIIGCGNADIEISQIAGLQAALDNKQNALIFDDVPTKDSKNPVMSSGIYSELQRKSNPNLLDNWYFAGPINQRGEEVYTAGTSRITSIDRWSLIRGTCTVIPGTGVTIAWDGKSSGSPFTAFTQRIESAPDRDRVYTFSAVIDGELISVTGTFTAQQTNIVGIIGLDMWVSGADPYCAIRNYSTQPVTITAAKLELGDQQTLAHQGEDGNWVLNDPPPNKALELAKCQRYQVVFNSDYWTVIGESLPPDTALSSSNRLYVGVKIPVPMRMRNPAVSYKGKFRISDYGKSFTALVSSIDSQAIPSMSCENSVIYLNVSTEQSISADRVYYLTPNNDPAAKLILDANL